VGDVSTKLYAPTTTVTQTLTEGTEIGEVNGTKLYAPTGGGSDVTVTPITTTGTNIANIAVNGTTYNLFAPSSGGGGGGHNYSTDEQVIGTWIDGSTLYEKTIEYTSSIGTGWTTLYQDTSISIKDYKASIIIGNDGSAVLNVYQRASNNYFTTTTLANGNGLRIYNSGDTRLGGTITIQYTKTS
jgi:hypothetical protein